MVQTQHDEVAAVWGLEQEAWSQDTNMQFACLLDIGGTQLHQMCVLLWEELCHLQRQFSASVSTAERGTEQGTSILVCGRFSFSQYLVLVFYNVALLSCVHICISQGGKGLKDQLCFSSNLYSEPYQPTVLILPHRMVSPKLNKLLTKSYSQVAALHFWAVPLSIFSSLLLSNGSISLTKRVFRVFLGVVCFVKQTTFGQV